MSAFVYRNDHSLNTNNKLTEQTAQIIRNMIIKYIKTKTKTKIIDKDKQSIYRLIYEILDYIREDVKIVEDLFSNPFRKGDDNYLHEIFIEYFENILLNTTELQNKYNSYKKDLRSRVRYGYRMPKSIQYYKLIIEANNFVNNIITKYPIYIVDIAEDLISEICNEHYEN